MQDLSKCGLVTLIGFSARVCKGKSSLYERTFERTIWPDINSTLHSSVVNAAARLKQGQLNCLWYGLCGFWLRNPTDKKSRKKVHIWMTIQSNRLQHKLFWTRFKKGTQCANPCSAASSNSKAEFNLICAFRESVYVETQPWTFLIHLQQTFTHFHHACTKLHNVQQLHTDKVKPIS